MRNTACVLVGFALTALEALAAAQPEIGARVVKVLRVDGALFKDLNRTGRWTSTRTGAGLWPSGWPTSSPR
jgi:hypothetical protein